MIFMLFEDWLIMNVSLAT